MALRSILSFISSLLLASTCLFRLCSAGCFTPNGTERNEMMGVPDGWYYAPCNSLVPVSMCCAIGPGRGNASEGADTCRSDGTCYNKLGNIYYRESCTDETWTDPACTKLFLNGSAGPFGTNDVKLYLCDDGSYCDMDNTTDYSTEGHNCCAKNLGYFIGANGTQTRTNPNDTSSSTSSSAPTATSSFPPASSTGSSSSSGLSTGAKAGIGVGVGLAGLAILICAGIFIYVRHSRRSRAARNTADPLEPIYASVKQAPPGELSSSGVHKGYSPGRVELETGPRKAPGAGLEPQEMVGS